jgi:hypothetical protein
MRLVAGIVARKIAVDFTNLVVNECYELAGGSVITQYDPNWGGVLDVDQTVEDVKNAINELRRLFTDLYDNIEVIDCSKKSKINDSVNSLNAFNSSFGDLFNVTETVKNSYQTSLTNISNSIVCKVEQTCPSSGGRLASTNSDCGFDLKKADFERILGELEDLEPIETIKNIILFVNGYRGPDRELIGNLTNHLITESDVYGYWSDNNISGLFKARRNSDKEYYADGSMSITTSNHIDLTDPNSVPKAMTKFAESMASSFVKKFNTQSPTQIFAELAAAYRYGIFGAALSAALVYCKIADCPVKLNQYSNFDGFDTRKNAGKNVAGVNLLDKLQELQLNNKGLKKINLDIIAHSMGFAYAQGIIEYLKASSFKDKINWTGYYILAPEIPGGGTIDPVWSKAQVWQYGSNLGERNADSKELQDGVATQQGIGGINDRRAFIPNISNGRPVPKNFLDSHSVKNYWWAFDLSKAKNDKGYIEKR